MKKIWTVQNIDPAASAQLASQLGISQLLAGILIGRGFDTKEKAQEFLHPELTEYYDPYLLPDMRKAVNRIGTAIEMKERIIIYGDYDADGTTATALLFRCLSLLGANVGYYVPDRFKEGFGMNLGALKRLKDEGASLIVTVDNGIAAVDQIKAMNDSLTFIVTDHHIPDKELPPALAVVDHQRVDNQYPCPYLSGAGISYKLCQALWEDLREEPLPFGKDIAAIGTVADIVPLVGENRKLAAEGLRELAHTKYPGLKSLIKLAYKNGLPFEGNAIGFGIGPRINSAGRLKHANLAVELLITDDPVLGEELAQELNSLNNQRKFMIDKLMAEAEKQLEYIDLERAKVLVVAGQGWHQGLIGLVAGRLTNKYYKPCYVITLDGDTGHGSARSIKGFHLMDVWQAVREENPDLFIQIGGHSQAAGFSIYADKIDELRRVMNEYANRNMDMMDFIERVQIDALSSPETISMEATRELKLIEPCGEKNPAPVIACRNVKVINPRCFGRTGDHLQFETISGNNQHCIFKVWWQAYLIPEVQNQSISIVYNPVIDTYTGIPKLEMSVKSSNVLEKPLVLSVDFMRWVYVYLRDFYNANGYINDDDIEMASVLNSKGCICDRAECIAGIAVFKEIGWLHLAGGKLILDVKASRLKPQDSKLFKNLSIE